ncbi:hypothetical protein AGMMS49940_22530 [Spirochaetia bacterium]|nr:hypothetical protein AGMMS49940_22530 [Spirochaetia bacterium]
MHIKNIFNEGELQENSVCKDFLLTAADGKKYQTKYYNLDAILSIGYRVNSINASQFRIWAMEDWAKRLDGFLEFNGNKILTDAGRLSHEQAKLHAETEYEKYRIVQDRLIMSDFDKLLEQTTRNQGGKSK